MSAKLWVIIPSAGRGKRFGSSIPKQYHPLLNKTVLQHTIGRFIDRDDVAGIVIATASDDQYIQQQLPSHVQLFVVEGGEERSDSVLNALTFLESLASANDLVAVHDAARPCVRTSSLNQLFARAKSVEHGAILALPATDTVKFVESGHIEKTVDRDRVWMAQTPQVFPFTLLFSAMQSAKQSQQSVTDEASAVELMGVSPVVVEGKRDNIKITSAEDLALAEWFLKAIVEEGD